MIKKIGFTALVLAVLVGGIAVAGGNITTRKITVAGNAAPTLATDGLPLNTVGTAVFPDPGQPVTRAKVSLLSTTQFAAVRVNAWRFINDAGWARDVQNDYYYYQDAGYAGSSLVATIPDILYGVNGNSSRIAFNTSLASYVLVDGGTSTAAEPQVIIETTWH